ncbi:MAG: helix-turn-helix domain-containing protein [Firmicutes bacterium]|nr:helix-turn-helix domain-containing protein [Bacillota bacterium]
MDKNEIIRRISRLRTKANLSARELSHRIDLNDGYINRLESKKDFLPSMEVFLKIIAACGSVPVEFFYHDIDAYKQDVQIIELLNGVGAEKKAAVIALLK